MSTLRTLLRGCSLILAQTVAYLTHSRLLPRLVALGRQRERLLPGQGLPDQSSQRWSLQSAQFPRQSGQGFPQQSAQGFPKQSWQVYPMRLTAGSTGPDRLDNKPDMKNNQQSCQSCILMNYVCSCICRRYMFVVGFFSAGCGLDTYPVRLLAHSRCERCQGPGSQTLARRQFHDSVLIN